ncbi:MAG: SH3 domain-containing protein [Cytophagales bacterium]
MTLPVYFDTLLSKKKFLPVKCEDFSQFLSNREKDSCYNIYSDDVKERARVAGKRSCKSSSTIDIEQPDGSFKSVPFIFTPKIYGYIRLNNSHVFVLNYLDAGYFSELIVYDENFKVKSGEMVMRYENGYDSLLSFNVLKSNIYLNGFIDKDTILGIHGSTEESQYMNRYTFTQTGHLKFKDSKSRDRPDVQTLINDKDGYVNLREGKSTDSKIIIRIPDKAEVELLENEKPNEMCWCQVKYKEKVGYVHKSRLRRYFKTALEG